ncbi:hypothetical protein KP509_12G046600 [Ceratopteris richardii]|uniref:Ankyrin repeat domain-containing protein n=1 Tax=Ceratopteris richardii TaxID=49495 RepID=A0A8T2TIQ4_CERRI|nr:hypothetical protein KP509_12G046600 [Ceratopteris richardii]
MAFLSSDEIAKYSHSPIHYAVARKDYIALHRLISALPRLAKAGEVRTEEEAITEEHRAEALSAVIDRRDVPGRETPLHLAVRMGDVIAAEILMSSGADWSLQNEQGWSALQEAICARQQSIAMIIMKYYQPMAWAKWCRRLPRVIGTMKRMRDFYMEVTFHFESSVIPFIGRIAPSDTYRIWKRASNLRADMTLAGFDSFRIQRSDQTFLFLGEGSDDGKLAPGSLCVLNHKEKEVMNALEGVGVRPTESETAIEVAAMSQTNMYRPGIDVTEATLVPQLSWRRHEKTEMVGSWKAKVYDMHHVQVSVKSRRVPGAMTDEELFGTGEPDEDDLDVDEDYSELLTEDEKKQLETVLKMENAEAEEDYCEDRHAQFDKNRMSCCVDNPPRLSSTSPVDVDPKGDKKGWIGWGRKSFKQEDSSKRMLPHRSSVCVDEKVGSLLSEDAKKAVKAQRGRKSVDARPSNVRFEDGFSFQKETKDSKKVVLSKEPARRRRVTPTTEGSGESEYKKGLRPVLWLTPSFPLNAEELLPLLDILANKVKAVRRLRELLITKLPAGTFPVKVAIPVVPTIRVVVTFTKFEELRSDGNDNRTQTSSLNLNDRDSEQQGGSWFSWIKSSASRVAGMGGNTDEQPDHVIDPFTVPSEYVWTSMDAKKRKHKDTKLKKKGRRLNQEGLESAGEAV